jgi:hypothetical protein
MVSPWFDGVWFRVPTRRQGKLKQREVADERGLQWQLRISVASGFSTTLPTPGSSAVTSRLLSSSGSCSQIPSLHPMLTMRTSFKYGHERRSMSRPVPSPGAGPALNLHATSLRQPRNRTIYNQESLLMSVPVKHQVTFSKHQRTQRLEPSGLPVTCSR